MSIVAVSILLIDAISIVMPTVLLVTLTISAGWLAMYKSIVTGISAIEDLASITILCTDKTGTLTKDRFTSDSNGVYTYDFCSAEDTILLASCASNTERPDEIDACILRAVDNPSRARAGTQC